MSRGKHIQWTEEEKKKLIDETTKVLSTTIGLTWLSALNKAQESLPAERRRELQTINQVPWLQETVTKKLSENKPKEVVTIKEVKTTEIIPQRLSELETEVLIQEIAKRTMEPYIQTIINKISMELKLEIHKIVMKQGKQEIIYKQEKPKVLIIGLLSEQENEIKKNFDDFLNLKFWNNGNPKSLRELTQTVKKVFIMRKFISHSYQDLVRNSGAPMILVDGAVSNLNVILEKYIFE